MDAADCERTWRNVLRPEINRDKWTGAEEADLQVLVEKYNMRNWTQIAEELGTNRTPFQCLQHYQQNSMVYDNSPWTPEEDELLKEVVETCKFGKDAVHFHQVAYYIEGRSAQMCSKRWEEINPEKKKGRWTGHEDCLLMASVQMLGTNNWLKVADLVPTRTAAQCRERWSNVLDPEIRPKTWTYEEDKELLNLIKQHGCNWAYLATLLVGRTDNGLLQRYRKLMSWKQQCEEFFAMPEKLQKRMILGQQQMQRRRGRQRQRPALLHLSHLNWYVKKDFKDYSDVGSFAKQIGAAGEDYDKVIQDKLNNEFVVPRPLPITRYNTRYNLTTWNRKRGLQQLVEAQIKKAIDENPYDQFSPTVVANRVATDLLPVANTKTASSQWTVITTAMKGRDPNQLSVRELLRISRHIKKHGKAPSDEEDLEEPDDFTEDDIEVMDVKPKKVARPIHPDHKMKLLKGLSKRSQINKKLQETVISKYRKRAAKKALGRPRKYRLFPRQVFESQQSTEEQERLRRKSLLLMLKSMDVDSIQAFKKARKEYKQISSTLKTQEGNDKTPPEKIKHGLRSRSKFSVLWKPKEPQIEMKESINAMLELGKELNVTEDDDNEDTTSSSKTARSPNESNIVKTESAQKSEPGDNVDSSQVKDNAGSANKESNNTDINADVSRRTENQSGQLKNITDNVSTAQKTDNQSQSSNVDANNPTLSSGSTFVSAAQVQPYTKKLPFIPPNYTNLQALRALLDDRETLFDKACYEFKVAELRNEFYEKTKTDATPFMKTLLSIINPNKNEIKKRARRKLDSDLEKNSFVESIECVKKSREFTQLKARFQAMFTWPTLISTVKPPKDNKLLQPQTSALGQNGETEGHKDSEKENVDGESNIDNIVLSDDSSLEDSDSEMEINHDSSTSGRKRRLQNVNQLQSNDNLDGDMGQMKKRRKPLKMVELVYKDLEQMGDVQLTEKEEMEIMVMNIITRTFGQKKQSLSTVQFGRERARVLRRLGLFEKMRKLELGEENVEAPAVKPRKRREKKTSATTNQIATRRSSRLNHLSPLEVMAPVKKEPMDDSPENLKQSQGADWHKPYEESPPGSPRTEINIVIEENSVTSCTTNSTSVNSLQSGSRIFASPVASLPEVQSLLEREVKQVAAPGPETGTVVLPSPGSTAPGTNSMVSTSSVTMFSSVASPPVLGNSAFSHHGVSQPGVLTLPVLQPAETGSVLPLLTGCPGSTSTASVSSVMSDLGAKTNSVPSLLVQNSAMNQSSTTEIDSTHTVIEEDRVTSCTTNNTTVKSEGQVVAQSTASVPNVQVLLEKGEQLTDPGSKTATAVLPETGSSVTGTNLTVSSTSVTSSVKAPLILTSPPLVGNSTLSPSGSPFGLITLPVLPPVGLPEAKTASILSSPGFAGTTLTGSNVGLFSSPSEDNTIPSSSSLVGTEPTSITIQAVVGNNIVPMVLQFVNPASIGIGNTNAVSSVNNTSDVKKTNNTNGNVDITRGNVDNTSENVDNTCGNVGTASENADNTSENVVNASENVENPFENVEKT